MSGGSKAAIATIPAAAADGLTLIGGLYRPDLAAPFADAGRGHSACKTLDRRGRGTDLMAIPVAAGTEPRAAIIASLALDPVPGLLNPLTWGAHAEPGRAAANYVICAMPPGPSLAAAAAGPTARISDFELIESVLRPVAHTLDALAKRCFTHRAIRPDNIFRAGGGQPAVLGAAWSGPAGALQPAAYEPPYLAQCHRSGRGEGAIADDIYALGVTLLALALGDGHLLALDEEALLRRKLHVGSFAALVEDARLPSALSDLLRGMLAEDPEHRPPPALLTDPGAARARRVAARPPRLAQRPIEIGGIEAWNARSLAYALATCPEPGAQAIKSGAIDRWLRRSLGDVALAQRLDLAMASIGADSAAKPATDSLRLVRATAVLDPLAPFHWRGLALWPDALGAVLAGGLAQREVTGRIEEIIETQALVEWAEARPERCDVLSLRSAMRHLRTYFTTRGMAGQLTRVLYALNPALPCQSALAKGTLSLRLGDLLVALDLLAAKPDQRQGLPVDPHILGFIAAHSEHRHDAEIAKFATCSLTELPLAVLRLLADIESSTGCPALPHLGAWLAALCLEHVQRWHSKDNRTRLAAALKSSAESGSLRSMLRVLEDRSGRADDQAGAAQARAEVARIDAELASIKSGGAVRADRARAVAHDTVGAAALAGLAGAIAMLAFG